VQKRREIGPAVTITSRQLGIKDDSSRWELGNRLGDVGIALAPLSATSAEKRHASTVLVDLDAEAVELDLMKPAIPYRRLALINMSHAQLSRAAVVPVAIINDFETGVATPNAGNGDAIRKALERAGIEFIDGDQPGVRLRVKQEKGDK
jgi:hypothetical protein